MININGPSVSLSGSTEHILAEITMAMVALSETLSRATGKPLNDAAMFVAESTTRAFADTIKKEMEERKA